MSPDAAGKNAMQLINSAGDHVIDMCYWGACDECIYLHSEPCITLDLARANVDTFEKSVFVYIGNEGAFFPYQTVE